MLDEVARKAAQRRVVDTCEVGRVALLLSSQYTTTITAAVIHVYAGYHIEWCSIEGKGVPTDGSYGLSRACEFWG